MVWSKVPAALHGNTSINSHNFIIILVLIYSIKINIFVHILLKSPIIYHPVTYKNNDFQHDKINLTTCPCNCSAHYKATVITKMLQLCSIYPGFFNNTDMISSLTYNQSWNLQKLQPVWSCTDNLLCHYDTLESWSVRHLQMAKTTQMVYCMTSYTMGALYSGGRFNITDNIFIVKSCKLLKEPYQFVEFYSS